MSVVNILVLLVLLLFLTGISYHYRLPGTCLIDPTLEKIRKDLIKIDPRLAKLQYFPGDESYTEDKERIFLCMKDEKAKYYSYNTLLAVALHESAHALCPIIDKEHKTPEFNNMHEALRKRATSLGLFNPDIPVPSAYCPKK